MKLKECIVYIIAYLLITIILVGMLIVNLMKGIDFETYLLVISIIISLVVLILLLTSVKKCKSVKYDKSLEFDIPNDYNVIFVANCVVNGENCTISIYASKDNKLNILIKILTVGKNPVVIAEFNLDETVDINADGENDIDDIILINGDNKYNISKLSPLKKQKLINLIK